MRIAEYDLSALPDVTPERKLSIDSGDTILDKLWRIALYDVERNFCIETEWGRTFSAGAYGKDFSGLVFNRDVAYSGLLGLNRVFPEKMLESLKTIRECRKALDFHCFEACGSRLRGVDSVICEDLTPAEFFKKHRKASAINKTDDVCWLWCAEDLLDRAGYDEWEWLYENGEYCFSRLYEPFYDESDGMYYGQPTFIDVGHSGYPDGYNEITEEGRNKCVWLKAASTNCLYYKGLRVMERAARILGKDAGFYSTRAGRLKESIRKRLIDSEGHICYFLYPDGKREKRRDALGTAFCVLCGIAEDKRFFEDYPIMALGVPLLNPFYPRDDYYHNNSAWPFADTFFLKARDAALGTDSSGLRLSILLNAFSDGHFREYRDLRSGEISGSWAQLWTTAAFIGVMVERQ